ncbi:sensor histidine kinase [Rhodococcus gannanensis]|uniref:histidine kinase n=1 Tax=Rhodococcus gannanensis TaxID=1960308 RepID=A0ABW4PD18_9NOCA
MATLLVAVALTVGAAAVLIALYRSAGYSADVATTARARQIADIAESEGVGALDESVLTAGRHVDIIQVVDDEGQVVASGQRYPTGPIAHGELSPGEEHRASGLRVVPDGIRYRVAFVGVATPDAGPVTVEVGADETRLYSRVVFLGVLSVAVIPLIVLGTALLSYYFIGRTLKPVNDIRRQVDEISGGDPAQRVPVPDTGDEIATLASTMNAMLDRIDSARTQQMRFVNDASHELNSPLTTLVGLLDLSRSTGRPIDPETVETVMMPEALRLQSMVADLLFLARADESGVPLRLTDVDLDELVAAEVTRLEALGGRTVTARIVAARVRGDEEKLARALRNITDNAVRHADGAVDVTMSVHDGRVRVVVSDDGPGIAEADRERVLERFVRLDDARERTSGGSGLGLAIVTEIVSAHDGNVVVADSPGGGAAVGFDLPVQTWD